jgi:hypothetical protein
MSFLEAVIQKTKRLEGLLEERYQAVGRGLHEKATSIEHKLDSNTLKQIRFIASVRNKLVHEDGYRFDDNEGDFLKKCDEVIGRLTNQQPPPASHTAPRNVPRPVEPAPRYRPEPSRLTSQTTTRNSYSHSNSAPANSNYTSAGSSSRSRSASSKSSESNIGEVFKNSLRALLAGVCLYPVIGLGGCLTRIIVQGTPPDPMSQTQAHDTWLYSPLKAWTTEAILIPLLIVAITFFVSLIKSRQDNPVLTILIFLLGVPITIYIGSGLTKLIRRDTTAPQVVNNSTQSRIVGTMREVNTTNLNMRSGPGSNYSVVSVFPKKARIVSYGETRMVDGELWTQASTPDGQTRGWVNRKFLSP